MVKRIPLLCCLVALPTLALLAFFESAISTDVTARVAKAQVTDFSRKLASTASYGRASREERAVGVLDGMKKLKDAIKQWPRKTSTDPRQKKAVTRSRAILWKACLAILRPMIMSMLTDVKLLKVFLPSVYLRYAANKEAAIKVLFDSYGVNNVASDVLASRQFQRWFAVIKRAYKPNLQAGYEATLERLTAHLGEKELFMQLAEAPKVPAIRKTGQVLDGALLNKWIDMGVANLLVRHDFQSWLSFKSDEACESMIELLLLKMEAKGVGEQLDVMLDNARKTGGDADGIATAVELISWKKSGLSASDMFQKMQLDNLKNEELLDTVDLYVWYEFLELTGDAPDKLLLSKLLIGSSEENVAKLLFQAAKDYDGFALAGNVGNALLDKWKASHLDAGTVAERLGIKKTGDKLFDSVEMDVWDAYLLKCHGDDRYNVMLIELRGIFGQNLPEMIAQGSKSGSVIAKNLALAAKNNE